MRLDDPLAQHLLSLALGLFHPVVVRETARIVLLLRRAAGITSVGEALSVETFE